MLALVLAVCFLASRRFGVEPLKAVVREVMRDAVWALEEARKNDHLYWILQRLLKMDSNDARIQALPLEMQEEILRRLVDLKVSERNSDG